MNIMITNSISANLEWIKSVTLEELKEYLHKNRDKNIYYNIHKTLKGGLLISEAKAVMKLYQCNEYYREHVSFEYDSNNRYAIFLENWLFTLCLNALGTLDLKELLIENGANHLLFQSKYGVNKFNIKTKKRNLIEIAIFKNYRIDYFDKDIENFDEWFK